MSYFEGSSVNIQILCSQYDAYKASSGFGLSMTKLVLKGGDVAIATARQPHLLSGLQAQFDDCRLLVVRLDVTQANEIVNAFELGRAKFGRIDIVYNNAGQPQFNFVSQYHYIPLTQSQVSGLLEKLRVHLTNLREPCLKWVRSLPMDSYDGSCPDPT